MSTATLQPNLEKSKSCPPGNHVVLPGQTPEGEPFLSVILKRSYNIVANSICSRADEDNVITPGDVPWESPLNSSIKFESDFVPFKLATDVVLNGKAYAPPGRDCKKLIVALQIGNARKEVLVVGNRHAIYVAGSNPRFTEPESFEQMDLKYELAYGGIDVRSDLKTSYPYSRNLLGRGFVVANSRESVDGLSLPNLEDTESRLTPDRLCVLDYIKNWADQPMPTSLGWLPKTWQPRASYAGVMPGDRAIEQELRAVYAKLVPADQQDAYKKTNIPDMDFRFFNGASAGLSLPYLQGGESVSTDFLTPEGRFTFQLPSERPAISIDIGEEAQQTQVVLHTVMIHMEERKLDMVWRGGIRYPGLDWFPQMKKMEIVIQ